MIFPLSRKKCAWFEPCKCASKTCVEIVYVKCDYISKSVFHWIETCGFNLLNPDRWMLFLDGYWTLSHVCHFIWHLVDSYHLAVVFERETKKVSWLQGFSSLFFISQIPNLRIAICSIYFVMFWVNFCKNKRVLLSCYFRGIFRKFLVFFIDHYCFWVMSVLVLS